MNQFALQRIQREQGQATLLDILVDGKSLRTLFAGRRGAHPSEISPLGWSMAPSLHSEQVARQFLGEVPSVLKSGRVPVLVCPACGDEGCGCLATRISIDRDVVVWDDWKYENGWEEPQDVPWDVFPSRLEFSRNEYESALLLELKL